MTLALTVSTFESKYDKHPRRVRTTWPKLVTSLTKFRFVDDKSKVPLWCPCEFKPGTTRAKSNVLSVSCLVWDYDDGTTVEQALKPWLDWPLAFHTSFSHTSESHKFRIVLPLAVPVPGAAWGPVWDHFVKKCAHPPDPACKDASRMYYVPSAPLSAQDSQEYGADGYDFNKCGYLKPDDFIWAGDNKRPKTYRPRAAYGTPGAADACKYNESESERYDLAVRLGASMKGNRAYHIRCPGCSRDSAYFFTELTGRLHARCNHEGASCGWSGPVKELES